MHVRCQGRCSCFGVGSGQLQWYQCAGARAESRPGGGRAKDCVRFALRVLTRTRGSIGADIAGVDAEVSHLRADLENAKEDLQRTNTELAAVQAEANRFSLTLTGVKHDLDRQGRTCKSLEEQVSELRGAVCSA